MTNPQDINLKELEPLQRDGDGIHFGIEQSEGYKKVEKQRIIWLKKIDVEQFLSDKLNRIEKEIKLKAERGVNFNYMENIKQIIRKEFTLK